VLVIAALASAPWLWHFNSTLESIATNVFATVLVTPVLIFGVEQVLERVAARRNAPRDQAILDETEMRVARMLNGAVSEAKIPGYEDTFVAAIKANGADYFVEHMSDLTATFVLEHRDQVVDHFSALSWSGGASVLYQLNEEVPSLELLLPLARDVVNPDAFAAILGVLRDIGLATHQRMVGDHDRRSTPAGVVWADTKFGVFMAKEAGRKIAEIAIRLAEAHQLLA
jgi:hypothetical protein